VRDGWMAVAGQMRQSRALLPPPPLATKRERTEEEERRAAEKAALEKARHEAETAALVVGARVEGRYQASVPGMASSSLFKNTHWFPGRIQAIDALEGTYEILYDDGDHEKGVKRRFVRLPPTATQKRERAEEEEEERRAADTAAVEKTRQAADTTALEKAGQPEMRPSWWVLGSRAATKPRCLVLPAARFSRTRTGSRAGSKPSTLSRAHTRSCTTTGTTRRA